jgi:hypothetical protein
MFNFFNLFKALLHDRHIGFDDCVSKAAEFFLVLSANGLFKIFFIDVVISKEAGNAKEGAEEGVALHASLQVFAAGGRFGDSKAGKNVDADLAVENFLTENWWYA